MPDYGMSAILNGIRQGQAGRRIAPLEPIAAEQVMKRTPAAVEPAPIIEPSIQGAPITDPPPPKLDLQGQADAIRPADVNADAEAVRLQKLNLGDYDLGETWQPNYDVINTADDVKAVIADAAERTRAQISAARRGVVTNDQLRSLAEDIGADTSMVEQVMRREAGGDLPPPETVLAARQFVNNSADRLITLAKQISTGEATDLEKIRFRRQLQLHDEFMSGFMGVRAEYGRGLNAFGIPLGVEKNALAQRRLKDLIENLDNTSTEAAAKIIAEQTTAAGVAKATKRLVRSKIGATVQEAFISSILSGPQTHVVNNMGSALWIGMNVAETALAARVGRLMPGGASVKDGEAAALAFGALIGIRDGLRYAAKALRTGDAVYGSSRRVETDARRAISAKNYFGAGGSGVPGVDKAIDLLGHALRFWVDRVMVPSDEFWKAIMRNMEASRLGYLKALDAGQQKALTADEFADLVRSGMDTADEQVLEKAGLQGTYQMPLGDIGRKLEMAVRALPGGFLVAPFIRTPTNLFKEGLFKRSPLAAFTKSFWRDIKAGGPARDMAVARVTLGSLTSALVAQIAASGQLTGTGPQNTAARDLWLASGRRPYSFRMYDPIAGRWKWQSYARLEPIAWVVGATADATEIGAALWSDEPSSRDADIADTSQKLNDIVAMIVGGVAQNTLDKSFMAGVSDFVEALSDPGRYMTGYVSRMANSLLPWSSFRAQMNKIEDPLIRQAWEAIDVIRNKSGIPGYSDKSPPRRDPFGNVRKWDSGELMGPLSVFPSSPAVNDTTVEALLDVWQKTGSVPVSMPSKHIEGMKMSGSEYDRFVVKARAEPGPNGLTFKESLDDLVASAEFRDATPDEQLLLIRGVQQSYDSRIRGGGSRRPGAMEVDEPDLADRLAEFRLRQEDMKFGVQ